MAATRKNCEGYVCSYFADQARPGLEAGIQNSIELWAPPWVSIFCLPGWVGRGSQRPWAPRCREGCWTSPGEHDICERLSRGEEGKDDPVHHPFHLRAKRQRWLGPEGPLTASYARGSVGEGTHSGPRLCLRVTPRQGGTHRNLLWTRVSLVPMALVQSHPISETLCAPPSLLCGLGGS